MKTNEDTPTPKKRGRPKGAISKPRLPKVGRPKNPTAPKKKTRVRKAKATPATETPPKKNGRPLGSFCADPSDLFCVRVPRSQRLTSRLHKLALLMRAEGEKRVSASDLARRILLERLAAIENDWREKIRAEVLGGEQ